MIISDPLETVEQKNEERNASKDKKNTIMDAIKSKLWMH